MRTTLGHGSILAYLGAEDKESGPRYRIKLESGTESIRPCDILHCIENPDGVRFVRREGVMEKEVDVPAEGSESAIKLDKKFKLLFGTESIYLFIRLLTSLVSLLDDVEIHVRDNPCTIDPVMAYYDPMKSQEEKKEIKLDFPAIVANLKSVISGELSAREFETFCRRASPDAVHKMAALPKLIERGASMLKRTAEEDLLLPLFDYCQYTGAVSILRPGPFFALLNVSHNLIRCAEPGGVAKQMSCPVTRRRLSHSIQYNEWPAIFFVSPRERDVVHGGWRRRGRR